jgi:hypothetical protein
MRIVPAYQAIGGPLKCSLFGGVMVSLAATFNAQGANDETT